MAFSSAAAAVYGDNPAALLPHDLIDSGKNGPVIPTTFVQDTISGVVCVSVSVTVADGRIAFCPVMGQKSLPIGLLKRNFSLPNHFAQQCKVCFKNCFARNRLLRGVSKKDFQAFLKKAWKCPARTDIICNNWVQPVPIAVLRLDDRFRIRFAGAVVSVLDLSGNGRNQNDIDRAV